MLKLRAFPIKEKNRIIGYNIQDLNTLRMVQIKADELKENIRNHKCECINLTLTSDNRLVQHEEKPEKENSNYLEELKALETDDYQHRGGNYPRSGIPDGIDVDGSDISAIFKSTSEQEAARWLQKFLTKKGFIIEETGAYQVGDYHNDWVTAYATVVGKR